MASRPVRPAALSQMPGAKMRGVSGSSMGSQGVPAGKTVSRWAERRMQGRWVGGSVTGEAIARRGRCRLRRGGRW